MRCVKWGEYRLRDLFNHIEQGRRLKKSDQVKGVIPFVMSGTTHQGIVGYISNPVASFPANSITVDIFGNTFYRSYSFGAGDDTGVYWNDIVQYSEGTMLFIASAIAKLLKGKYSYGHKLRSSQSIDFKISLPQTNDGKIDFAFMERYVHEVEELRLFELEKACLYKLESYLHATGLKDHHLSSNERSVLTNFHSLHWGEFCIGDIFVKIETEKLPYMAKDLPKQPTEKYTLPCLTSSFKNQGLNYYVPREGATILNNAISIPSNSDVYRAYYQPNDFTILSDSYAIRWKDETVEIQPLHYLFMVTCINKVTDLPIYSYKNKLGGWNVVKDKNIYLPVTANGDPDFAAMKQLISALQKVVIADVAKYTSRYVDATRQIIESKQSTQTQEIELRPLEKYDSDIEFVPLMAAEHFECYKWEGFDQSISNFFGRDKTILIGCYKGKKYENWINTHQLYNIRLGDTKGSMEANRKLFDSTSLLVLYELGQPNKLSAYKIVGKKEMGKDELMAMDYPNKKPRKRYMTFSIIPLEIDLTFLVEHQLIERLIALNSDNAKGTPVFIQP